MEPHFEAIRQWRRQRKTWNEIAGLLASEKGIHVTLLAPYRFMRRRLKRSAHWEDEPVAASGATSPGAPSDRSDRPSDQRTVPILPKPSFHRPDPKSFNPDDYL